MRDVRTVVLGTSLAIASLGLWEGRAAAQDLQEAQPELHAGVRLGVSTALAPQAAPLPMGSVHADLRFVRNQFFLTLSPGLYLPGAGGNLSYGGLGLELGGGWTMADAALSPYLGAGVSGRLQLSGGDSVVGFAPYTQLGVLTELSPSARLFAEARVYQNVLPVEMVRRNVYPTEIGLAFGILF